MKRITGTHVYAYAKCPRQAALDLHLDRSERRPPTEQEEFALARGREFEAAYVAGLDVAVPDYPERDFAAGASATLRLLHAGAPLVFQGVLATADRLGLPDLLRRVPGTSELGGHHYEVVDIKSSGRPRSDQILQVVFYSRLLAVVQGRMPEHGALVLKDRREERFAIGDFQAAAAEVERELLRLGATPASARPFLQSHCRGCHWSHRCLPELTTAQDLSLVQGMTAGARATLEAIGCRTVGELATFAADSSRERGHLDATLLRRLRRGAQAVLLGRPLAEGRQRAAPLEPAVFVQLLGDPFADRVLAFGVRDGAAATARCAFAVPTSRDLEWEALQRLLDKLPGRAHLLHFGSALPLWYEEQAFRREAGVGLAGRFVELGRRLRSAAVFPAPVFGLADFVQHGLRRDPFRAGHPGLAAAWAREPGGEQKLLAKLAADLEDLAALKRVFLDHEAATPEGALGPDAGTATA